MVFGTIEMAASANQYYSNTKLCMFGNAAVLPWIVCFFFLYTCLWPSLKSRQKSGFISPKHFLKMKIGPRWHGLSKLQATIAKFQGQSWVQYRSLYRHVFLHIYHSFSLSWTRFRKVPFTIGALQYLQSKFFGFARATAYVSRTLDSLHLFLWSH